MFSSNYLLLACIIIQYYRDKCVPHKHTFHTASLHVLEFCFFIMSFESYLYRIIIWNLSFKVFPKVVGLQCGVLS
jgi:hypothetical protein